MKFVVRLFQFLIGRLQTIMVAASEHVHFTGFNSS